MFQANIRHLRNVFTLYFDWFESCQRLATTRANPELTEMGLDYVLMPDELVEIEVMATRLDQIRKDAVNRALNVGVGAGELARATGTDRGIVYAYKDEAQVRSIKKLKEKLNKEK